MKLEIKVPHKNFTKADKYIVIHPTLSDGAKLLHIFLSGCNPAKDINDLYIKKTLNTSTATLARWKKELRDADLLITTQVSMRRFTMYIGYSGYPASRVKFDSDFDKQTQIVNSNPIE